MSDSVLPPASLPDATLYILSEPRSHPSAADLRAAEPVFTAGLEEMLLLICTFDPEDRERLVIVSGAWLFASAQIERLCAVVGDHRHNADDRVAL